MYNFCDYFKDAKRIVLFSPSHYLPLYRRYSRKMFKTEKIFRTVVCSIIH